MYLLSRNYLGPSRLVQELTVGCYIGLFYDPDKASLPPTTTCVTGDSKESIYQGSFDHVKVGPTPVLELYNL